MAKIEQLDTCVCYWSSCRYRKEAKKLNSRTNIPLDTDMAGEEERGVVRVKVKVGSLNHENGLFTLLACPLSSWYVRFVCFLRLALVVLPCNTGKVGSRCRTKTWHGVSMLPAVQSAVGRIDVSIFSFVVCFILGSFFSDSLRALTQINAAVTWVRPWEDNQVGFYTETTDLFWGVFNRTGGWTRHSGATDVTLLPSKRLRAAWRHTLPGDRRSRHKKSSDGW